MLHVSSQKWLKLWKQKPIRYAYFQNLRGSWPNRDNTSNFQGTWTFKNVHSQFANCRMAGFAFSKCWLFKVQSWVFSGFHFSFSAVVARVCARRGPCMLLSSCCTFFFLLKQTEGNILQFPQCFENLPSVPTTEQQNGQNFWMKHSRWKVLAKGLNFIQSNVTNILHCYFSKKKFPSFIVFAHLATFHRFAFLNAIQDTQNLQNFVSKALWGRKNIELKFLQKKMTVTWIRTRKYPCVLL